METQMLKRQNWDDRGQRFLKGFIGDKTNRGAATAAADIWYATRLKKTAEKSSKIKLGPNG